MSLSIISTFPDNFNQVNRNANVHVAQLEFVFENHFWE